MKSSDKNFTNYYIILISILISPLLIINSSYKLKQREQSKINDNDKNSDMNFLRKLDFKSDSLEICSKSSEDLINYFKTGDTNYVTLYAYDENKEPSEIAITYVNIIEGEGDEDENMDKIKNHLAPMIIFIILGFLCIPGWLIFCCCACCQCKCFKCFKTIRCRTPFFIIVSITNGLFIGCCIGGLIEINPIFEALTNTECSLLRFISEVLDGETKNVLPKWAGISGLIGIFENTINRIEQMSGDGTLTDTNDKKLLYNAAKSSFITALSSACSAIAAEVKYKYQTDYFLDIAYKFGTQENDATFTSGSYAEKWVKEAEITDYVSDCYTKLGNVLTIQTNLAMKDAQLVFQDIGEGIEEIKDKIGEEVLKYSEKIDKYGKIILKLVFSVLLIIAVLLETFFIFLLIFASRKCDCPKLACLMKFWINLFWNILALLVIVIFIIGGAICTIGTLAQDIFETISFVISSRNLLSPSPKIFENEASSYLDICINDDGEITEKLGIDGDLEKIGDLKTVTEALDKMIDSLTIKKQNTAHPDYVFDEVEREVIKRYNNHMDYGFINKNTKETLTLSKALKELNQAIKSCNIDESYSFSCNPVADCTSTFNTGSCMSPETCIRNPNDLSDINNRYSSHSPTCLATSTSITAIRSIFDSIEYAHSSSASDSNSIINKATEVKTAYGQFLVSALNALNGYTVKFRPFSVIYSEFIGNGSILSLVNCAFIGKNVKVLLNYLNDALGKGFITLGSVLVVIGFIMLSNITFTILLLSIINEVAKIRETEQEMVPKTNVNEVYYPYLSRGPNVIVPMSNNVKI